MTSHFRAVRTEKWTDWHLELVAGDTVLFSSIPKNAKLSMAEFLGTLIDSIGIVVQPFGEIICLDTGVHLCQINVCDYTFLASEAMLTPVDHIKITVH